jgi:hypothetical protein
VIETPSPPVDVAPPCLDEAEALPRVLDRIPPSRRGFGTARHPGRLPAVATDVRRRDRDACLEPALPSRVAGPVQRRRPVEAGLSVRDLPLLREADTVADAASVVGLCPPGSHFPGVLASFSEVAR